MPHRVIWLPEAVRDLARLRAFINEKNPLAARHAASRIKGATQILSENPEAGRPIEEAIPFRELVVPFGNGNYILRYRQVSNSVVIIRVRHSKEKKF